jgi:hypothetical protein
MSPQFRHLRPSRQCFLLFAAHQLISRDVRMNVSLQDLSLTRVAIYGWRSLFQTFQPFHRELSAFKAFNLTTKPLQMFQTFQ